jgi:hypothetical protein
MDGSIHYSVLKARFMCIFGVIVLVNEQGQRQEQFSLTILKYRCERPRISQNHVASKTSPIIIPHNPLFSRRDLILMFVSARAKRVHLKGKPWSKSSASPQTLAPPTIAPFYTDKERQRKKNNKKKREYRDVIMM